MPKQTTLDGVTFRPRIRYKENYARCRKCNKQQFDTKKKLCMDHSIDEVLDRGYGILPWILENPQEYLRVLRRIDFMKKREQMLEIYPTGKLL